MTHSPLILNGGQQQRLPSGGILNYSQPFCRVRNSGNQVITTNSIVQVNFNSVVSQTGGTWYSTSFPFMITIPVAGVYLVGGGVRISTTSPGTYMTALLQVGSDYIAAARVENCSQREEFSLSSVISAPAGRNCFLAAACGAGTVTIEVFGWSSPHLWAVRLSQ